jgi:hypothetical protein
MAKFDLLVPSFAAAKFLGITRGRVLELARSGEILVIRLGAASKSRGDCCSRG